MRDTPIFITLSLPEAASAETRFTELLALRKPQPGVRRAENHRLMHEREIFSLLHH